MNLWNTSTRQKMGPKDRWRGESPDLRKWDPSTFRKVRAPVINILAILVMISILPSLRGQSRQPLRPAELVQFRKDQSLSFTRADLLTPISSKAWLPELEERKITGYSIVQLNDAVVRQLLADRPDGLTFTLPSGRQGPATEVELVRVELFSSGTTIFDSAGNGPLETEPGLHYRGVLKHAPGSIAALSIFDDEVMGFFTGLEAGNLVLGKLEKSSFEGGHVLYQDQGVLTQLGEFSCETPDDGKGYSNGELSTPVDLNDNNSCIRIYLEVDHDVFAERGTLEETTEYITGLFNQASTLYANENIKTVISELFIWTAPSPYTGTNSSVMLSQFQDHRTTFNGDLAQLVSFRTSGGVAAGFSGLCNDNQAASMSFASIRKSFETIPVYSFSVMVVAHELGHLFGSRHTHACVWNGNNTAIDGCAGYSEGDCAQAGLPTDGGTVMSYCHITSVGINFAKGFGPQPGMILRNSVASAACLQSCQDNGGDDGGGSDPGVCSTNEVRLILTLDDYASETSWELRGTDGTVLFSGGPYANNIADSVITQTFCLVDGCHTFEIFDSYGDGMCCTYGNGSYQLVDAAGNILAQGGSFAFGEARDLCLPYTGNDPGDAGGSNDNPTDNGGSSCNGYEVNLLLTFDAYPGESSWRITDANGNVLHSEGPYNTIPAGGQVAKTMCLPEGCYYLVVEDRFGDGLCCRYGDGSYRLTTGEVVLAEGGKFGAQESTRFCLPFVEENEESDSGGSENSNLCQPIDLESATILPYGGGQDRGTFELLDDGKVLKITRNAWKAIRRDYSITANTILEFDFSSTQAGEVHGIGLDKDDLISADHTFRLFGSQNWGIGTYATYPGGGSWQHYTIPIGQFYTGNFDRLFVTADHDYGDHSGDAFFRNIRIYENGSCTAAPPDLASSANQSIGSTTSTFPAKPDFNLFPNPAGEVVNLRYFTKSGGSVEVQLFNIMGQQLKTESFYTDAGYQEHRLQISELPPGTYLVRFVSETLKGTKKLTVR